MSIIRKNQIVYMMLATLYKNQNHWYKRTELFYASNIPMEARSIFDRAFAGILNKEYILTKDDKARWNTDYTIKKIQLQRKDVVAYIDYEKYYIKHEEDQYPMDGDISILHIDDRKLLPPSLLSTLKREKKIVDGIVRSRGNYYFFTPEDRAKCPYDVYLNTSEVIGTPNAKVAVEIHPYDTIGKPCGSIFRYKGNVETKDDNDAFILKRNNIEQNTSGTTSFKRISYNALSSRIDMSDEQSFSIGSTDKAVSIKKRDGVYIVNYFIADVAHYITEGSAEDQVAFSRCLTHRLEGKTVPMFPTEFETRICNLSTDSKKLAICASMTFDASGALLDSTFAEVIMSPSRHIPAGRLSAFMVDYDERFDNTYAEYMDQIYMLSDLQQLISNKMSEKKNAYISMVSDNTAAKWMNTLSMVVDSEASKILVAAKTPMIYKRAAYLDFDVMKYLLYTSFDVNVPKMISLTKTLKENPRVDAIKEFADTVTPEQKDEFLRTLKIHMYDKYASEPEYNWLTDDDISVSITDPVNCYYDLYIMRIFKQHLKKSLRNEAVEDKRRCEMDRILKHMNHCSEKACWMRIESNKFGKV